MSAARRYGEEWPYYGVFPPGSAYWSNTGSVLVRSAGDADQAGEIQVRHGDRPQVQDEPPVPAEEAQPGRVSGLVAGGADQVPGRREVGAESVAHGGIRRQAAAEVAAVLREFRVRCVRNDYQPGAGGVQDGGDL